MTRPKFAFFIPLEDLADDRWELSVQDRLEQWHTSNCRGTFFLDSVDEARLEHPSAFRRALQNLVRALGPSGTRAHVVVSCRVNDWQYRMDLHTMCDLLAPLLHFCLERDGNTESLTLSPKGLAAPATFASVQLPHPDERPNVEVNVVRMAPLDPHQIALLATAWGVEDVSHFMTALNDGGLEMFAGRPRDLEWLIAYWREHKRFGHLTEMVKLNVYQKLIERNPAHSQSDEPLSRERARDGVEALAAAATLCAKPMVALPDPEIERDPPERSFWPREVLPQWNEKEIRTLLTRSVFDPATFGRVRFHDPVVAEYLAACWIARNLKKGARKAAVRDIVLRESFGRTYPVVSKRMVLGWLADKIPEIRREIITVAPDILLYCGDAGRVPVDERGQALRALAEKFRNEGRTDLIVYDSDVIRIVDERISPIIRELLQTEMDSPELIRLLLRMVKLGRLRKCADHALTIATDEDRQEGVRIFAAQAVVAAGSPDQQHILVRFAFETEGMSNRILGGFCSALFPEAISTAQCLDLASRGSSEGSMAGLGLGESFRQDVAADCPQSEMAALLDGLCNLAEQEPFLRVQGEETISDQFAWTAGAITHLLARIITEVPEHNYPMNSLVRAYCLLDRIKNLPDFFVPDIERLKKALAAHRKVNKPIYWSIVRARLGRNSQAQWSGSHLTDEWLVLSKCDLAWLLEDATTLKDTAEFHVALDTALNIWSLAGRPDPEAQRIAEIAKSEFVCDDLKRYVRNCLCPPHQEESSQKRERRDRRHQKEEAIQALAAKAKSDLINRVDRIRSGDDFAALVYFHEFMRRSKTANNSTWAQTNWQALVPHFGEELANAVAAGFKKWWRKWKPPFPIDRVGEKGGRARRYRRPDRTCDCRAGGLRFPAPLCGRSR